VTSTPSRLPYSAQAAIVVAAVLVAVGAPVAVGFALYGGHHRASLSGAANIVAPSGVTVVYPVVSGISPASGSSAGGTLVTITGTARTPPRGSA